MGGSGVSGWRPTRNKQQTNNKKQTDKEKPGQHPQIQESNSAAQHSPALIIKIEFPKKWTQGQRNRTATLTARSSDSNGFPNTNRKNRPFWK